MGEAEVGEGGDLDLVFIPFEFNLSALQREEEGIILILELGNWQ